ncbi:MAG: agmatinase [Candidatus Micrarchaeota archaeon]
MKFNSLGPHNFCGVKSNFEKSKAIVIPVPYDSTASYRAGTREGPNAIISSSRQLELFDLELDKNIFDEVGIYTLDELEPNVDSPRKNCDNVRNAVEYVVENNKLPIVLGGDHSITFGSVEAVKKKFQNVSILHFDAHSDLRDEFDGSKYSHACVMRRVSELGVKIVQVGIRSTEEECQDYIAKNKDKFKVFPAHEKAKWKTKDILAGLTDEVYISFDVDCLDPSIMPATGTPVPGGLLWADVVEILREVSAKKKIIACDFVELMPLPGFHAPDFLVANLVYKTIGYALLTGQKT